jgi:transcriptional regulator with XRE-family HTH domain
MGKYPRRRQRRLAAKLRKIRRLLHLSQSEMVRHLGVDEDISRTNISNYEKDEREPPLYVLLRYAQVAGVCLDVLVDDQYSLPGTLPTKPTHRGLGPPTSKRRTTKR